MAVSVTEGKEIFNPYFIHQNLFCNNKDVTIFYWFSFKKDETVKLPQKADVQRHHRVVHLSDAEISLFPSWSERSVHVVCEHVPAQVAGVVEA